MKSEMINKFKSNAGQMTVEIAVVFPVVIVIAVILFNALSFASLCASFDRLATNEIRSICSSLSLEESEEENFDALVRNLNESFNDKNVSVACKKLHLSGSFMEYTCELNFFPTLFGMELKKSIFGMDLPPLKHIQKLVVDQKKEGDIL